jgi:succinate dehydrogenase flavin-adding protein (antitoxin of CptAB toxin-antitoxin module)
LSSEVYTGTAWFRKYLSSDDKASPSRLHPKNEWIKVNVPPLISSRMLQLAREQLARNRIDSPRRTNRMYLFAKKLRCGTCGRMLTAQSRSGSQYSYYRGTYWTDKRCMECRFYAETSLEGMIWPGLVKFFKNPDTFTAVLEKYRRRDSNKANIDDERKKLAVLAERLKRSEKSLLDCELEGFYSHEVLGEKRAELDTQRKTLEERKHELFKMILAEKQRVEAAASAKILYEKIQHKLNSATYATRRLAFNLFIERVVLFKGRADVWLRVPREMAISQVSQTFLGGGSVGGDLSLCGSSYCIRACAGRHA